MARCCSFWIAAAVLATPAFAADGASGEAIRQLREYLDQSEAQRGEISAREFATVALVRADAETARRLLIDDWRQRNRADRAKELDSGEIAIGDMTLPIFYQVFAERPASGRSLFISLHGGGNAPPAVNDQQWRNQQRLYQPAEGVYVAPRAPTNTWNLWHEEHIDGLFDRLIEDMVLVEDVDSNRVYVMGYSAGGDGVYQLAPRMADRWAAASMMAGHPNETTPLGLRNVAFAIHVGELDGGYDRNKVADRWKTLLADLQKGDPQGYRHLVDIHAGKGHWMDREDASAVEWMSQFTRNPFPKRVVWKQDDVIHARFYWLAVDEQDMKERAEITGDVNGQEIRVTSDDVSQVAIRLSDELVDLDQPVRIYANDQLVFEGEVDRTIGVMARSLQERGDPAMVFLGEQKVALKP